MLWTPADKSRSKAFFLCGAYQTTITLTFFKGWCPSEAALSHLKTKQFIFLPFFASYLWIGKPEEERAQILQTAVGCLRPKPKVKHSPPCFFLFLMTKNTVFIVTYRLDWVPLISALHLKATWISKIFIQNLSLHFFFIQSCLRRTFFFFIESCFHLKLQQGIFILCWICGSLWTKVGVFPSPFQNLVFYCSRQSWFWFPHPPPLGFVLAPSLDQQNSASDACHWADVPVTWRTHLSRWSVTDGHLSFPSLYFLFA